MFTASNESLLLGGIQLPVILCGDFLQLAPVPNALCNEDGLKVRYFQQ